MRTIRSLAFGLLALLPVSLAAQKQLHIEQFDAEIVVLSSGTTTVTERITARFDGEWNGLYRSIPVNYRTPQQLNYRLRLELESATEPDGSTLRVESSLENGARKYKIWVPNARDVTRTIVLRYRVLNGIRFFENHDELYWNVTGDQWDVPIQAAHARIVLPGPAAGIRAAAFTGVFGSTASDASVAVNGNAIDITTTRPLNFHEGVTAVVGWNPGLISRPSAADKAGFLLKSNLVLLFPILILMFVARHWHLHGRDPRRLSVKTAYEPPAELRPAEVGTLLDNSPDIRDITATLVDLAVRGYISIAERNDEKLFGLFSSRGFTFMLVRDRAQWQELRTHERRLLEGIFRAGANSVDDTELKNRFYRDIPDINQAIFSHLVDQGHYKRRPDHVRARWMGFGMVAGIAIGALGVMLNARAGVTTPVAPVLAGILSAAIIVGFGFFMPARTVYGARTLEQVLGFEEFLRRVEADRFERVVKTPELFEKYLPFALALRVDENWCRAFQDIYTTPPQWYSGNHVHFSLHNFNRSLNHMTATTGQAMTSAPRSSNSSGSSGFSGGGSEWRRVRRRRGRRVLATPFPSYSVVAYARFCSLAGAGFHLLHGAQQVQPGDLLQVLLGVAAPQQLGKQHRQLAHVLQTDRPEVDAIEVGANADVVDARNLAHVVNVIRDIGNGGYAAQGWRASTPPAAC